MPLPTSSSRSPGTQWSRVFYLEIIKRVAIVIDELNVYHTLQKDQQLNKYR